MFQSTPSVLTPGSTGTVVYLKNYSYTYAWYYLPREPVKLQ